MKLLYVIAQEENGNYVSIPLSERVHLVDDNSIPSDLEDNSGIVDVITPEQEAEDDRIMRDLKKQDEASLDKILAKTRSRDEVSEEGL